LSGDRSQYYCSSGVDFFANLINELIGNEWSACV